MALRPFPGFCGPSYVSQSKIASADRCVNWLPERIENPYGKASFALYPVAAYSTYCTLPTAPFRGAYTLNGDTYAVGGDSLYRLPIVAGGSPTLLASGLHNPDDAPVGMASNGDAGHQLFITSGSVGYLYDLRTGALDTVLTTATQCAFLDGYFLALNPNLSELQVSGLENGAASEWISSGVARRNDAADKWIAMVRCLKEVWLFGAQTSSVYFDAGLSPFPFTPNPSVFIQYGITAPLSAAVLDNAPMWLGQSLDGGAMVYRAEGYTPRRVSNHALEWAMSQYSAATLLTARAFVYQMNGHSLYVLTFPGVATWVYDAATGLWHEEGDYNGTEYTGLSVFGHVFCNGVHLTGSTSTGDIYQMSMSPTGAPAVDPQLMLRWSNDGGLSFGTEHAVSAGAIGATLTRATWRRLGASRDRVYDLALSDPAYTMPGGAAVRRQRTAPHVAQNMSLLAHDAFRLDFEPHNPSRIVGAYVDVRGGVA